MEFTGERFMPQADAIHPFSHEMAMEHYHRYLLAKSLAVGKDVLDIASGEGYGSAILATVANSVIGVDLSGESVDHAASVYHMDNLRYRQGDAAAIPLPDACVDLVVSFETIEHHARHEEMMREVVRVLRPGGVLCLSSPERAVNADILPPHSNPYHVRELYRAELVELVERHFSRQELYAQKIVFGSMIIRETAPEKFLHWRKEDMGRTELPEGVEGLCEPKYYLLLATNGAELPQLPCGLLEASPLESEAVNIELKSSADRLVLEQAEVNNTRHSLAERDWKIGELEKSLARAISQHEAAIARHKAAIAQREAVTAQREATIQGMLNSRSWRITAPLRGGANLLRRVRQKLRAYKLRLSAFGTRLFRPAPPPQCVSVALISGEPDTQGHIYRMERLAAALRPKYQVALFTREQAEQQRSLVLDAHVLWIWRAILTPALESIIHEFKKQHKPVIFDIDDMCFHPSHFQAHYMDAIRSNMLDLDPLKQLGQSMFATAQLADICVLTTDALAHEMYDKTVKPTRVIPNSFARETLMQSVEARQRFLETKEDAHVRIGYASGTATHQADLKMASPALAMVMERHPEVRLVLFNKAVDIKEFPELENVAAQIEWRDLVPLKDLPGEVARFDINIAPLEVDNIFCNCKSELKFFEAALAGIPSVLSATQPMRAAVRHGVSGFLVSQDDQWEPCLEALVSDADLRERMGREAKRDVLWTFGPENRSRLALSLVTSLVAHPEEQALSFVVNDIARSELPLPMEVPHYEAVYASRPPLSRVAVVIPLYNYANYIVEALDSLLAQTLESFDVIVVDDASTDNSAEVVKEWFRQHQGRFASVSLLRNRENSRLSLTRNAGIDYSNAEYVMLLDADNALLPECLEKCAAVLDASTAAAVCPGIELFGMEEGASATNAWQPLQLRHGNYIDAMAMIRKAHWAALGGYTRQDLGWEDYDFWCKMVRYGFWGQRLPEMLAKYRVHENSMLRTLTDKEKSHEELARLMSERHNWLRL